MIHAAVQDNSARQMAALTPEAAVRDEARVESELKHVVK